MSYRNRNRSGGRRGDSMGGSRQMCGPGILGNAPGGMGNMNPLGMQNMMGGGTGMMGNNPGMMGMNQGMGMMGQNNMGLMNQGNMGMGNMQQQALRESQLALVNTFLKGTIMGGSGIGMMGPNMMGGGSLPSLLDIKTSGNKRRRGDSMGSSDGKRVRRESFEHNRSRERDRNNRSDRRRQQEGSLSKKRDQHSAGRKDRSPDRRRHDTSGSGETKSEEKEMYDPADPTDDEVKAADKNGGLTVTIDKKGRSVSEDGVKDKEKSEQPEKKSQYFCHACMVECHNEKNFGTHMKGSKHRARMDELANLHQQKSSQLVARLRAEEHLRKIEKRGGSKREFCKVCDKELNIPYGRHKQTRDHQIKSGQCKRGCRVCAIAEFPNHTEFSKHVASEEHIQINERRPWPRCMICNQSFKSPRKYIQHLSSSHHKEKREHATKDRQDKSDGLPDDLDDLVTIDSVGDFDEDNPEKWGEKKPKIKKEKEAIAEDDILEMPEYDPNVPLGQNYIIPVSGFFCKLCHKFYNSESAAKFNHCQTKTHFEKLEKVIAEKIEMQKEAAAEKKATEMEVRTGLEDDKLAGSDEIAVDQHKNIEEDEGKTTVEIKMEPVGALDETNDNAPEEGSKTGNDGVMQETEDELNATTEDAILAESSPTSDNDILQQGEEIMDEESSKEDTLLADEIESSPKEEDGEEGEQTHQEGGEESIDEETTPVARTRRVRGRGGGRRGRRGRK